VSDFDSTVTAVSKPAGARALPWNAHVVHQPSGEPVKAVTRVGPRGLKFGREPGSRPGYLAVPDSRMSRLHAVLEPRRDGGLVLADNGSKNGTFVNGRRVDRQAVQHGDVIRLGDTLFVLTQRVLGAQTADDLGMWGSSAVIEALRESIRRVAPSELSVLITGDTGTGKELVARAIHARSGRSGRFVAVNCAALPHTLVESTLFGHRKGAFTGAVANESGAFAQAHRGTLFLDEVGEMTPEAQPKLLRALETGEVTPVGAGATTTVDVRVVAATNRPLMSRMDDGLFRDDLYARLAGVVLETPPLAARPSDILPLFRRFTNGPFDADFAEALLLHTWPMNVRELRKLAERLPVMHPNVTTYEVEMLDAELQRRVLERTPPDAQPQDGIATTGPPTKETLIALLAACGGNVSLVGERVGRSRKQVYRWMETLGIPRGTGRT